MRAGDSGSQVPGNCLDKLGSIPEIGRMHIFPHIISKLVLGFIKPLKLIQDFAEGEVGWSLVLATLSPCAIVGDTSPMGLDGL